jgi:perosamine synthetase
MIVPVNRPLITGKDRAAVLDALENGDISGTAPLIGEIEQELSDFFGGGYASLVSSGTSACDLATVATGIKAGDKVLVSASTILSTVSQAVRLGAKIDTLDVNPDSWNVDFNDYRGMNLADYKAIYPVHLYGLQSNISVIQKELEEAQVDIIEDAAEAFSQKDNGKYCGTRGRFGIFSFYSNKLISAGEGGLVLAREKKDHLRIQSLKNLSFGKQERLLNEELSWNLRMSALSAALLRSQLRSVKETLALKQALAARYREGLTEIDQIQLPLPQSYGSQNHYWVFGFALRRDSKLNAISLATRLKEKGVETRRFFPPLHLQPTLQDIVSKQPTPIADHLWDKGIYIPFGSGITLKEIDYVTQCLREILL